MSKNNDKEVIEIIILTINNYIINNYIYRVIQK